MSKYYRKEDFVQHDADELPTTIKGSIIELKACAYFLELGYEVYRNISPTGKGDIIIWKKGEDPIIIDVKSHRVASKIHDVKIVYPDDDGNFVFHKK
jgi:hypothetical protein